jgi:hypothetical protein
MDKKNNILSLLRYVFVTGITLSLLLVFIPAAESVEPFTPENFGIVADGDIRIPGGFSVKDGHVCSRTGEIDLGGSGFSVKIPEDLSTDYAVIVNNAAEALICGSGAVVPNALVDNIVNNGGSCTDLGNPVPCPANPQVIFPAFTGVGQTICNGTIVPGIYGDVVVPKNATCTFDGEGDYIMTTFTARDGSTVLFDTGGAPDPLKPINIYVQDYMAIREFVVFNPGFAASVYIYIQNGDSPANPCPVGLAGLGNAVFCNQGDGSMEYCLLLSDADGTVSFRGSQTVVGWDRVGHFKEKDNRPVTTLLPNPAFCMIPPAPEDPDCACYYLFTPEIAQVGDPITMTGHSFRADNAFVPPIITVDFIGLVPVGTSIPESDPLSVATCSASYALGEITINSDTSLTFDVPACPAGDYRLVIVNHLTPTTRGPWCSDNFISLTVQ